MNPDRLQDDEGRNVVNHGRHDQGTDVPPRASATTLEVAKKCHAKRCQEPNQPFLQKRFLYRFVLQRPVARDDRTGYECSGSFARLLQVHNLKFEDEVRIRYSLAAVRRGADLSDELLVAMSRNQGCREFATFDTAIAKRHTKFAFVPKD